MNTYNNNNYYYYYENTLQTPRPNTGFTRCLYSVHVARPQRAHGALEDPQRCHFVPTVRCLTRCANAKPRRLF